MLAVRMSAVPIVVRANPFYYCAKIGTMMGAKRQERLPVEIIRNV
jgi:hypothetical protein